MQAYIYIPCPSNVEVLLQHGDMSMYYFKAELTSMFYFLTRGRKNGSSGLSYQALKQSFHIERQVNHSGSQRHKCLSKIGLSWTKMMVS